MHAASPALQVDLCHILPLDDDSALLRVAGRWAVTAPEAAHLLVGRNALIEPLPPGPAIAPDGQWSAGFQVGADAIGADFALVTPDGGIPLPRPVPAQLVDPVADLEEARGVITHLSTRCEVNERELSELRGKLVDAWAEVSLARETVKGREAEYEEAGRHASQAVAIVDELKARAERAESGREDLQAKLAQARSIAHDALDVTTKAARELLEQRAKAEQATELAERYSESLARSERELGEAREQLAALEGRVHDLEAQAAAARERLAEAEAALEAVTGEVETLRERAASAEQADAEASAMREELNERSAALDAAAAELEALRERAASAEQAEAEASAMREDLNERSAALDAATAELEALRERAEAAEAEPATELAALREELAQRDAELEAATAAVEELRERTEAAERTEAELAELQERFGNAVARADALEQELAAARQAPGVTPADEQPRGLSFGRSKVSARVHTETLEQLDRAIAEREQAENEAAQLSDRVRELESEIASYHDQDTAAEVEQDLRHLLATRQRELDETRDELKEQRARYAAVASKMSPTELAATTETRTADEDWTALDDELLNRLARAKQLSQPD